MKKGYVFLLASYVIIILALLSLSVLAEDNSTVPGNSTTNSTNSSMPACQDSDNGLNYDLRGYISGLFKGYNTHPVSNLPDTCSGNNLIEYYCSEGYVYDKSYSCQYGCSEGACLQVKTNSTTPGGDMNSCLDNLDYWWDQQTNQCYKDFSKELIAKTCSDPDSGINKYLAAHTFGFRSVFADSRDQRIRTGGKDSCISNNQLIEHFCDESGFIQTTYLDCPNGCQNGECIKGEDITEKVACVFDGSNLEQGCYSGDSQSGCRGIGSCIATISTENGKNVTWKSSCGGYQYSYQDGDDEKVVFDCSHGALDKGKILDRGFKNAYWQCSNGKEWKSEGKDCKPADKWKEMAINFCNRECSTETTEKSVIARVIEDVSSRGKCGVNSFSIGEECYLEDQSNICKGQDIQNCCAELGKNVEKSVEKSDCVGKWTIDENKCSWKCKENENDSLITICKDSCSLDGKCYPFGYRKGDKYCSDAGAFTEQLKSDIKCENNFECGSNVCVSNKCVSQGAIDKILNWFKRLFGSEEQQ